MSNNSDVSATSWSGTIQAAGPAQTQLGNQIIAPNSLSRESDRSNGLSVTDAAVLPSGTRGLPSANRNSRGSLTDLDALVQSYQLIALTDNTARAYNQGARAFFNFCMHYNLPVGVGGGGGGATPNGIDEQTLLYFAAHCAHHMKLSASTINLYLYGLRNWCVGLGFPNPLKN